MASMPQSPMDIRLPLRALGLAVFVSMLGVGNIVPLLPLYAKGMGASSLVIGLIFGAFAGARLLATPFVGSWSDLKGRKPFIVVGLMLMAGAALVMMAASSPWELVASRAGMGIASSLIMPVSLALVADLTPVGHEGRSFGGFGSYLLFGMGMGPLVGGVFYDLFGVDANFLVMAVLSVFAALIVLRLVKDPPRAGGQAEQPKIWHQFKLAVDNRMLGILCARSTSAMSMGFYIAFLPLLGESKGLNVSQVGMVLAVNTLVMTFVQKPSGMMADRMSRMSLAACGFLASGVVKACMPLIGGFWGLLALSLADGIAAGLAMPALTASAVDQGKKLGAGMGEVMSLFTIGLSVGVFCGPVMGGDHGGLLQPAGGFSAFRNIKRRGRGGVGLFLQPLSRGWFRAATCLADGALPHHFADAAMNPLEGNIPPRLPGYQINLDPFTTR